MIATSYVATAQDVHTHDYLTDSSIARHKRKTIYANLKKYEVPRPARRQSVLSFVHLPRPSPGSPRATEIWKPDTPRLTWTHIIPQSVPHGEPSAKMFFSIGPMHSASQLSSSAGSAIATSVAGPRGMDAQMRPRLWFGHSAVTKAKGIQERYVLGPPRPHPTRSCRGPQRL
jgi:hypothetical protein